MHPIARVLLWCGWAAGVELAALPVLYSMAVVSATAFMFPRFRLAAWRLLRRTRWLMAVLLLTYAYTQPGSSLWPELAWASPTLEGVRLGLERILRLALIVIALAVLLSSTERSRLIYGLYGLARPLGMLGFDRRAFAVRLGLTLGYVEQAAETKPRPAEWLQQIRDFRTPDTPDIYSLSPERWKGWDSLSLLTSGVVLALLLWP